MGVSRLVDRRPSLSADELVAGFVPPARFASVRFSSYVPNPAHRSQAEALAALEGFAAGLADAPTEGRFFRRARAAAPSSADGIYLDGGYGVGKTHLIAALWHAAQGPSGPSERGTGLAAYLSFGELTAVIGFVGMPEAVRAFSGYRLLCIDEFELDDVANTLMTVTFLRSVMPGTRVVTTSNSVPDQLGEGRFAAADFRREIAAIADHFAVIRIDGPDYRGSSMVPVESLSDAEVDRVIARSGGLVIDDRFGELLDHLRVVHPVQFVALLDGVDTVAVRGLCPIENQGDALLFVHLVDELYDAGLTVAASGCDVHELFPDTYRHGGYRKKYGRAESRLTALLAEATAEPRPVSSPSSSTL